LTDQTLTAETDRDPPTTDRNEPAVLAEFQTGTVELKEVGYHGPRILGRKLTKPRCDKSVPRQFDGAYRRTPCRSPEVQ
jgi:hypothetical protein